MSVLPIEVASVFDFQNFINFGSYGSVLKVMKKSTINLGNQKCYAMKIVVTDPEDNNSLKNAEAELKVLLELNNPYIINLDSYFKVEDKVYMALEYCPNRDLLKAMADKKSENQEFDEDEIWKYFIQTSFGLEALHTNEFIHRDIKPQNILLDENMDVKLADFGLSRHLQASSVAGTLPFYSPRMCNGDFPTKESDIWALGCVLYCLCNFEDPFKGNKHKIQKEEHMPIKSQYSQELRYFVDWCLKKKRNERPTINEIITHEFIINKTVTLGITIPTTSAMSTIYRRLLISEREKILKLESKLSEYYNEIINEKTENERLKEENASLKKIIADKDIKILSVKTIETVNPFEEGKTNFIDKQEKSLLIEAKDNDVENLLVETIETVKPLEENKTDFIEKQPEEKSFIEAKKIDTEKTKEILGDSDQDLNRKTNKTGIVWCKDPLNILDASSISSKKSEILMNPISPKLEEERKTTFSAYENNSSTHLSSKKSEILMNLTNPKLEEEHKKPLSAYENDPSAHLSSKQSEILKNLTNPKLEEEHEKTFSAYENDSSTHDMSVVQASTYHKNACLLNILGDDKDRANFMIYNTETEIQESKIIETPEPLDTGTCITQLPNGKLFCFGRRRRIVSFQCIFSGIALLIDENYRIEVLPSGTPCYCSSAIYFNDNIYCFGGLDKNPSGLTLSSRFDLGRNQWNKLKKLPKADFCCSSIIFNGSILISGWKNKNLLRYSIDRNTFTKIPFEFSGEVYKLLLNSDRLYLIECRKYWIHECEIGSDTVWWRIAIQSNINFDPDQTYCLYKKSWIYIGCAGESYACFKFDLNGKRLIKL